ncbi:MAG: CBS domain-containing protein [Patescibacteria group bacterium]
MSQISVASIMTKRPIAVGPDDSVVFAAKVLADHNFNGLPVVGQDNKLIGIVTEYDLISKSSDLHLPTLINILSNLGVYKKDTAPIKGELKRLLSLKVKDIMNADPLTVSQNAPVQELVDLFAHHHRVNPIPVIDDSQRLVGIVSRFDLVQLFVDENAHREVPAGETAVSDKQVDQFVTDFEKRFILVSKTRARFWPVISLAFALVGFIIAFGIIIRIAVK